MTKKLWEASKEVKKNSNLFAFENFLSFLSLVYFYFYLPDVVSVKEQK